MLLRNNLVATTALIATTAVRKLERTSEWKCYVRPKLKPASKSSIAEESVAGTKIRTDQKLHRPRPVATLQTMRTEPRQGGRDRRMQDAHRSHALRQVLAYE